MKKHGLANLGQVIGNICAGKISDHKCERKKLANWELNPTSKWIISNVNIVDVDQGNICEENAILMKLCGWSQSAIWK